MPSSLHRKTYQPSGSAGGGDDGPALSAGVSSAIDVDGIVKSSSGQGWGAKALTLDRDNSVGFGSTIGI